MHAMLALKEQSITQCTGFQKSLSSLLPSNIMTWSAKLSSHSKRYELCLGNFTMMSFHLKVQVIILILHGIQSINFVFQMEMRKKDGMLVDEKNARMKV